MNELMRILTLSGEPALIDSLSCGAVELGGRKPNTEYSVLRRWKFNGAQTLGVFKFRRAFWVLCFAYNTANSLLCGLTDVNQAQQQSVAKRENTDCFGRRLISL